MAIEGVGSTSVFQSPGIGSISPTGQAPSPAPVVPEDDQPEQAAAAPQQQVNAAPTDDERAQAEAQGKTRGAFVDIRA